MAAAEEENKPPSLPQYPEMIMAAISALDDKNGSNKTAISKYIESSYGDLPVGHATLLVHHLNKMKQNGELVMVKNNYMKPDPNAPPRRGRGRPPKPKPQLPPGTVLPPPRPRGRPKKDPSAPRAPVKKSGGSSRPRGRPKKVGRPTVAAPVAAAISAPVAAAISAPTVVGSPRPRGRPPKSKTPLVAAGI